jgi:hypothetical protein
VKGLGIAAGARRPGAKKSGPAEPAKPATAPTQPEPAATEDNGEASTPPVKGLGIARGARPPGKR